MWASRVDNSSMYDDPVFDTVSHRLMLNERHVYENCNSLTRQGDVVRKTDKFYHWGALLTFIPLAEHGMLRVCHRVDGVEKEYRVLRSLCLYYNSVDFYISNNKGTSYQALTECIRI